MNRIAFIMGENFLYWHSIILTLAAVTAICMYWALAVRHREDRAAAVIAVPVAIVLSLVFARLVHWYCRPQGYKGMFSALTDYSRGSYALVGVFAGCLLTALLLRIFKLCSNLPRLLDHMCIAGALGISVGRLSSLFTTADRGILVPDWVPFPFASRLINDVSGQTEVRLAVFMLQAAIAGILFFVLLFSYLRGKKRKTLRDGDTCLKFLLWYCASQAVLDSPRYDSLYFRSNGFVSVVQIFGVLTVLLVLIIFSVRMLKARRWSKIYLILLTLPLLGLAGYMEYYVQRHGSEALLAYSVMSASMFLAVILISRIYANGRRKAPAARVHSEKQPVQQSAQTEVFSDMYENLNAYEQQYEQEYAQMPMRTAETSESGKRQSAKKYKGKFASR